MQHSGFHHPNIFAEQLRTTIDTQGTEMLAMLQELVIVYNNPSIEDMPPPTASPDPAANAVVHTDVQIEMLRILQEMRQSNTGRSGRGGQDGRGDRGRDGCERTRCTPENAKFPHCITDK